MRMDPRHARMLLRGLALLATLASSAIGFVFVAMAGGLPPGMRFLFMVPIVSAPVLVTCLVLRPGRARRGTRETRMALRENGLVEEDRTIVLIKQKRSKKYF